MKTHRECALQQDKLSRELGFDSIKGAAIHFAGNVKELMEYFRT